MSDHRDDHPNQSQNRHEAREEILFEDIDHGWMSRQDSATICLAIIQWVVVAQLVIWDNLLTINATSGRVNIKYYKLPTAFLYSVGSLRGETSLEPGHEPQALGVLTSFVSSMLVLLSISHIYLYWLRNRARGERMASTPKNKFRSPRSFMET